MIHLLCYIVKCSFLYSSNFNGLAAHICHIRPLATAQAIHSNWKLTNYISQDVYNRFCVTCDVILNRITTPNFGIRLKKKNVVNMTLMLLLRWSGTATARGPTVHLIADNEWICSRERLILTGAKEKLEEKPVPVPLCPPQTAHGLT
jgi:hypothetical protein